MSSVYDILRKGIANSGLSKESKTTYLNKIENLNNNQNKDKVIRDVISNPLVNTTLVNIGFNPSNIMYDTYRKPIISFKSNNNNIKDENNNKKNSNPINKKDIDDASIITKEQVVGIGKNGKPEIIKSSKQIVKIKEKYTTLDENNIPLNQKQSYLYSDEEILLDEKIVDKKIPFSKKLKK